MTEQEQFKDIKETGKEILLWHGLSALVIAINAMLKEDAGDIGRGKKEPSPQNGNKKKKRNRAFPAEKRNLKAQLERRRSAREKSSSSLARVYSSILCESIDCLRRLRH